MVKQQLCYRSKFYERICIHVIYTILLMSRIFHYNTCFDIRLFNVHLQDAALEGEDVMQVS